jgi:8-oxo-dGTP diphosphatase
MKEVAKVIIYTGDKILLQHRDSREDINNPDTWSLFGGELENGESPKGCVIREIEEEIGAKMSQLKIYSEQTRQESGRQVRDYIFGAKLTSPTSSLSLKEGQDMKFFTKRDLRSIDISPAYKRQINNFFTNLEKKTSP